MKTGLTAIYIFFAFFIGAIAKSQTSALPSDDLQKATDQFREFLLIEDRGINKSDVTNITLTGTNEIVANPHDALAFANSLEDNGGWKDIDYKSKAKSDWPPGVHTQRILAMAAMAKQVGVSPADKARLLAATHRAFEYWIQRDLQCSNWWFNQIGGPKTLGSAALLLNHDLNTLEFQYVTTTLLPRSRIGMTGQNRVWLAGNNIMLGMLTADAARVDTASKTIWNEIAVTEKEGIQPDYSFHQHGPQQQFGNYGAAFAVEGCRWGQILRDTPWAMPAEKLAVYRHYLLDGQDWITYRGQMDISSCGRQLMPDSPQSKARSMLKVMQSAALFDPSHAADYLDFVKRNHENAANDLVGNRCFWRSDYIVHRQPDFMITLKMHSARTIGTESINSENLSGYFLSDGATYLYHTGIEYQNIFPVWDWNKLPGVTCSQCDSQPPPPSEQNLKTDRTFVGGVSDDRFGCAAMDLNRDGLTAKKAWFFGATGVVCLGADIHSSDDKPIATTINQCLLAGPVTANLTGHEFHSSAAAQKLEATNWIEQGGWRYTFFTPSPVWISTGPRSGNWHRIYNTPATPSADLSKDLFTLWFDHGAKPAGATYSYAATLAGSPVSEKILSNTPSLQAVLLDEDHVACVFWKAGQLNLTSDIAFETDSPCTLILNRLTGRATVADPTHLLKSISLTFDSVHKQVDLPLGGNAGQSVEVNLR